eukprot:3980416-Pleurochrysis_carterae.AAC.1
MAYLNFAELGSTVKHDVFGLCTLLNANKSGKAASLKVKVNSDGIERELTSGHFQSVRNEAVAAAENESRKEDSSKKDDEPG